MRNGCPSQPGSPPSFVATRQASQAPSNRVTASAISTGIPIHRQEDLSARMSRHSLIQCTQVSCTLISLSSRMRRMREPPRKRLASLTKMRNMMSEASPVATKLWVENGSEV